MNFCYGRARSFKICNFASNLWFEKFEMSLVRVRDFAVRPYEPVRDAPGIGCGTCRSVILLKKEKKFLKENIEKKNNAKQ